LAFPLPAANKLNKLTELDKLTSEMNEINNEKDKNNNEKTGNDQLIVPCDLNEILDDELKSIIQTNLKKDVTLIALFDCCHSGTICDMPWTTQYDKGVLASTRINKLLINNKFQFFYK
jgi:hypothetical protein